MAVERGCSFRVEGGVYACSGIPGERNIERFLYDPPRPLPSGFELAARGVKLWCADEYTTHVIDHVGSNSYIQVPDFVEEAARFGVSRRLELRSEDYSRLSYNSQLIFSHSCAIINNFKDFYEITTYLCPTHVHTPSPDLDEMCCGLWYEDIKEGVQLKTFEDSKQTRTVERTMPSFKYVGRNTPEEVKPNYSEGFFMHVPIQRIEVIKAKDNSHEEKIEKLKGIKLPVYLVEE